MSVPLAVFHSSSVKLNTWEGALTDLSMGIPRWGSGAVPIFRSFPLRKLRMKEVQHINSSLEPQRYGTPHVKWKEQKKKKGWETKIKSEIKPNISIREMSFLKSQEGKNDQSKTQSTKKTKSYVFCRTHAYRRTGDVKYHPGDILMLSSGCLQNSWVRRN